jgi:hypothetical protein
MRPPLVALMIGSYLALAAYDAVAGNWRTGVASGLLAVVNLLLLGA